VSRPADEAARKAEVWRGDLGSANCVPGAVLSGVYYHHMLLDAQNRGLTLFWSHSLETQLLDWLESTKPE
jgi:hypothetical protein